MASTHTDTVTLSDGREVYMSYGVIVAAFIPGRGRVRTKARFSVTTSKHMNQFVGKDAPELPHEELKALCSPVTSKQ